MMTIVLAGICFAIILSLVLCWKGGLNRYLGAGAGAGVGLLAGAATSRVAGRYGMGPSLITLVLDLVLVVIAGGAILLVQFYRDPERYPPGAEGIIVAPADGKIKYIRKISKNTVPFSVKG